MLFKDRYDAGRRLALRLERYRAEKPVILALPRGGVPVGLEIAQALGAPLDVIGVRKLGAPSFPEFGMGAIAEGGTVYLDVDVVRMLGATSAELARLSEIEANELERRVRLYRAGRPMPDVEGRTVILVDDGVATGGSIRAAIRAVRERDPARLVVAVPVIAADTATHLEHEVEDLVYIEAPDAFSAVGVWYEDFAPTSDAEVIACLDAAREGREPRRDPQVSDPPPDEVLIPLNGKSLHAALVIPLQPRGIILFAHGTGSGRRSPRNQFVARALQRAGFATVLLDLLTEEEELEDLDTGDLRFDVDLLADRLAVATLWAEARPELERLPVGYFGASTGAAAAMLAASALPEVRAVVSRGGRPDLAGAAALSRVRAPALLVVGARDETVLWLNREAAAVMDAPVELRVVPGATHLFEEPGALEAVAKLAAGWFSKWLQPVVPAVPEPHRPHV